MDPKSLVSQLRTSVIEENLEIYRDLFESTSTEGAIDPYWMRALSIYQGMTEDQRSVLFEIIRQVMSDTVSNVLGILDGVSTLDGADDELVLTAKNSGQLLSGDLQDLFLEAEEEGWPSQ